MKQRKTFGFTLVEMIVTLMIIITLSLLSFPLYEGRAHKTTMLAEGYTLLGTIIEAQVSYYNEYGNFLGLHAATGLYTGSRYFFTTVPVLGINAINNRYFTSFNPFGNNCWHDDDNYKYHFTAIVQSAKAGTISLEYNKTQRFEPVVSGI